MRKIYTETDRRSLEPHLTSYAQDFDSPNLSNAIPTNL